MQALDHSIYKLQNIHPEPYCILLIICSEKVSRFWQITLQPQKFLVNFCTWILWKLVKAGNHKSFLGMKVKMWNSKIFSPQRISNVWYTLVYICACTMNICAYVDTNYSIINCIINAGFPALRWLISQSIMAIALWLENFWQNTYDDPYQNFDKAKK